MNRLLPICILLLFVAVTASSGAYTKPADVFGWDNLKWGMSREEVLTVFGKNVKERKPRVDEKEGLYAGLELVGIEINGQKLRASLWMDQDTDKLSKIVFVPSGQQEGYEWAETFINLEQYLVEKYGAPDSEETSNDPGTSAERKWEFPSTVIEMSYLRIEGTELLLLVFSENVTGNK